MPRRKNAVAVRSQPVRLLSAFLACLLSLPAPVGMYSCVPDHDANRSTEESITRDTLKGCGMELGRSVLEFRLQSLVPEECIL
jgi:hypothetical protein